jgi:hypothetical protein
VRITTPILKPKVVTGVHIALDPVLCLVAFVGVLMGAFFYSKGYALGEQSAVAQIAELQHNAIMAQAKYADLNAKYVLLQKAKPLDVATACPTWYMQQDLMEVKKRICGH